MEIFGTSSRDLIDINLNINIEILYRYKLILICNQRKIVKISLMYVVTWNKRFSVEERNNNLFL